MTGDLVGAQKQEKEVTAKTKFFKKVETPRVIHIITTVHVFHVCLGSGSREKTRRLITGVAGSKKKERDILMRWIRYLLGTIDV
jgi:hypothetical protein